MTAAPIRILIVDDHTLFREALARMLEADQRFSIVGHCATVNDALSLFANSVVEGSPVDVVLLDYDLGNELGTTLLDSIAVLLPVPRVVLVTAGASAASLRAAVREGIAEVVLKTADPAQLMQAIERAAFGWPASDDDPDIERAAGEPLTPDSLANRPLTRRQSAALHGILDGLTNREIALRMHLSESSVKAVLQELFHRAGVRTRSQLVRVAIERHSDDWIK